MCVCVCVYVCLCVYDCVGIHACVLFNSYKRLKLIYEIL